MVSINHVTGMPNSDRLVILLLSSSLSQLSIYAGGGRITKT